MKDLQSKDPELAKIVEDMKEGKYLPFSYSTNDILCLNGHVCVPKDKYYPRHTRLHIPSPQELQSIKA